MSEEAAKALAEAMNRLATALERMTDPTSVRVYHSGQPAAQPNWTGSPPPWLNNTIWCGHSPSNLYGGSS